MPVAKGVLVGARGISHYFFARLVVRCCLVFGLLEIKTVEQAMSLVRRSVLDPPVAST
jgi:hypothetical protein